MDVCERRLILGSLQAETVGYLTRPAAIKSARGLVCSSFCESTEVLSRAMRYSLACLLPVCVNQLA